MDDEEITTKPMEDEFVFDDVTEVQPVHLAESPAPFYRSKSNKGNFSLAAIPTLKKSSHSTLKRP